MKDVLTTFVLPLILGVGPAFLSYLGARHKSSNDLKAVKEQYELELKKLKEQQQIDLQKFREQQQAEMQKLREQSLHEIQRIRAETDSQAGLYEKNKQTDIIGNVMERVLEGDLSPLENLGNISKRMQKFQRGTHSSTRKRHR